MSAGSPTGTSTPSPLTCTSVDDAEGTLTPEGADYLSYVSEAFSLIATGTQRLPNNRANRTMAVSCAPTLASRWLLPRLRDFNTRWPNISVAVDTSRRQVGFPIDGFDFAIRMSRAPVAGSSWTRLFGEKLVPVCSPDYRASLVDEAGKIDLRQATLIHVTPASEDWEAWLDGRGIDIQPAGGLRFDTIQLAFEAAIMGLGVVEGRRPLVDRDIATGALVEIGPEAIVAETAYWLVSSEGADYRPDLLAFKRCLLREAEAFDGNMAGVDSALQAAAG